MGRRETLVTNKHSQAEWICRVNIRKTWLCHLCPLPLFQKRGNIIHYRSSEDCISHYFDQSSWVFFIMISLLSYSALVHTAQFSLKSGTGKLAIRAKSDYSLFCMAHELRMGFIFLNGWKNQKKNNILWHVKVIWNSNFSIHEVVYFFYLLICFWNIAILIQLYIVSGCFHTIMAKLLNYGRDHNQRPYVLLSWMLLLFRALQFTGRQNLTAFLVPHVLLYCTIFLLPLLTHHVRTRKSKL